MINYLRYVLEPMDDHTRLKSCITHLKAIDSQFLSFKWANRKVELDQNKFLSLMGMHDESIKHRINKWNNGILYQSNKD